MNTKVIFYCLSNVHYCEDCFTFHRASNSQQMHLLSLILTFLVGIQARNSPYAKMAIQGSLQFQEIVIRHEMSELF